MFTVQQMEWMAEQSGGVRIVSGGKRTVGHFDVADEAIHDFAQSVGARYQLKYPTGSALALSLSGELSIEGAAARSRGIDGTYEVRHGPMRIEDGDISLVLLADT